MSNDVEAEQDETGWTLRFRDPLVTQLRVDYRFSLLLEGGALIVLESAFDLWRGTNSFHVPPGEDVSEVGEALLLFNKHVETVQVLHSGELRIEFDGDTAAHVPVDPHFESWQILMPDGEQWIGTPGGGVAHDPGR